MSHPSKSQREQQQQQQHNYYKTSYTTDRRAAPVYEAPLPKPKGFSYAHVWSGKPRAAVLTESQSPLERRRRQRQLREEMAAVREELSPKMSMVDPALSSLLGSLVAEQPRSSKSALLQKQIVDLLREDDALRQSIFSTAVNDDDGSSPGRHLHDDDDDDASENSDDHDGNDDPRSNKRRRANSDDDTSSFDSNGSSDAGLDDDDLSSVGGSETSDDRRVRLDHRRRDIRRRRYNEKKNQPSPQQRHQDKIRQLLAEGKHVLQRDLRPQKPDRVAPAPARSSQQSSASTKQTMIEKNTISNTGEEVVVAEEKNDNTNNESNNNNNRHKLIYFAPEIDRGMRFPHGKPSLYPYRVMSLPWNRARLMQPQELVEGADQPPVTVVEDGTLSSADVRNLYFKRDKARRTRLEQLERHARRDIVALSMRGCEDIRYTFRRLKTEIALRTSMLAVTQQQAGGGGDYLGPPSAMDAGSATAPVSPRGKRAATHFKPTSVVNNNNNSSSSSAAALTKTASGSNNNTLSHLPFSPSLSVSSTQSVRQKMYNSLLGETRPFPPKPVRKPPATSLRLCFINAVHMSDSWVDLFVTVEGSVPQTGSAMVVDPAVTTTEIRPCIVVARTTLNNPSVDGASAEQRKKVHAKEAEENKDTLELLAVDRDAPDGTVLGRALVPCNVFAQPMQEEVALLQVDVPIHPLKSVVQARKQARRQQNKERRDDGNGEDASEEAAAAARQKEEDDDYNDEGPIADCELICEAHTCLLTSTKVPTLRPVEPSDKSTNNRLSTTDSMESNQTQSQDNVVRGSAAQDRDEYDDEEEDEDDEMLAAARKSDQQSQQQQQQSFSRSWMAPANILMEVTLTDEGTAEYVPVAAMRRSAHHQRALPLKPAGAATPSTLLISVPRKGHSGQSSLHVVRFDVGLFPKQTKSSLDEQNNNNDGRHGGADDDQDDEPLVISIDFDLFSIRDEQTGELAESVEIPVAESVALKLKLVYLGPEIEVELFGKAGGEHGADGGGDTTRSSSAQQQHSEGGGPLSGGQHQGSGSLEVLPGLQSP